MNETDVQLDGRQGDLGVGPVNSDFQVGVFGIWRNRNVRLLGCFCVEPVDWFKEGRWYLNEFVDNAGGIGKPAQHDDRIRNRAIVPEKFDQLVPAVGLLAGVLNPGCFRQLRDVNAVLAHGFCR